MPSKPGAPRRYSLKEIGSPYGNLELLPALLTFTLWGAALVAVVVVAILLTGTPADMASTLRGWLDGAF